MATQSISLPAAASASFLSSNELSRIRSMTLGGSARRADPEIERDDLHKKSQARVANWTNTLEGQRIQKELRRKQKAAEEEARKKGLDQEEAQIASEKRRQAIERAAKMLFDETDRVKTFHGTLLVSDVLKEREAQLEHKKKKAEVQKVIEEDWRKLEVERLKKYDEEERRKAEDVKRRALEEARINKLHMEEMERRFHARIEEDRREGEIGKMKAELEFKKARKEEMKRMERLKRAQEETRVANEYLQQLRADLKKAEEEEEQRIEAYAREKEETLAERRQREQERFNQKQAQRQRLIDSQTRYLEELRAKEKDRTEKHVQEKEEKDEKHRQEQAAKRQAELDAMRRNRLQQMELKARHKAATEAEMREYQRQLAEKDKILTQEEEELRRRMLERNRWFAEYQKRQWDDSIARAGDEKDEERTEAARQKAALELEDQIFNQYTDLCIQEYEAAGKSTLPMKIHLAKKQPMQSHI